jgi:hypothetical protein
MAGQQVMRGTTLALLGCLAVLGCRDDPPYEGAFDLPIAIDVLPTALGPYSEPVGFAANGHGGEIATLALKQGRFLTDDPTASFLRGNWIPTGGNRVLSSVAVYAPSPFDVRLFAGDRAYGHLVQVPWIVGSKDRTLDGEDRTFPVEQGPEAGPICFVPAGQTWDANSDDACPGTGGPELVDLEVKHGYTTSETWTVSWAADRQSWRVEGSRSGRQEYEAVSGTPFIGDKRRVGFTVRGSTTDLADGDSLVFTTSNGLTEHDVGGIPMALAMAPDHSALAIIVEPADGTAPFLSWFDPAAGSVIGTVALASQSRPVRMDYDEDGRLWVADAGHAAAWEVEVGATSATEHPLPWPTLDVAPLHGESRQLFALAEDGQTVWRIDADTNQVIDINAAVPGDQGMFFGVPVTGIDAITTPYRYPEVDEVGVLERLEGRGIAVALHSGRVVFMEETTGCLVQDGLGPRTTVAQSYGSNSTDVSPNFEVLFGPVMEPNLHNDRHVLVNPCAGVARGESWEVRFDASQGGWVVSSTTLGENGLLAHEDQRYQSDMGEVSFTLRAGSVPTQHGWSFAFSVHEGALQANGDVNGDGQADTFLGSPGDPVAISYLAGPKYVAEVDPVTGVATPVSGKEARTYVLVPATAADHVARVSPETAEIEVQWD